MTDRPKPYIGISGVVNPEQQIALGTIFREQGLDDSRVLALGVKATHKTQMLDVENKYGRGWYPVGDELMCALERRESELHVAQVFVDQELAQDQHYRRSFIDRIHRRGRLWLNTIQFDMLPIGKDASLPIFVDDLKNKTRLKVILQAHSGLMESYSPKELAKVIGCFAVDYVLLDSSHGKGLRLNVDRLRPYVEALYERDQLGHVGVGVAGGLDAEVVASDLPEIIQQFPNISWDAEGRLHRASGSHERPINLSDAKEYLVASAKVLQGV